jgi:hypothetical protein
MQKPSDLFSRYVKVCVGKGDPGNFTVTFCDTREPSDDRPGLVANQSKVPIPDSMELLPELIVGWILSGRWGYPIRGRSKPREDG